MKKQNNNSLENYFEVFRNNVVGYNQLFNTPFGKKKMIYADWTASGRLYAPIEDKMTNEFGSFVGNTHTESTVTGKSMTLAYRKAKEIIKEHVHANKEDVFLVSGSGMTAAVNKFQRILGLRIPEKLNSHAKVLIDLRPIVFITHMEHHSNHTSWLETIADVECIPPTPDGFVDLDYLDILLEKYKNRKLKIAAVTACSNVTGISTPFNEIAKRMHQNGGLCFVDFACSAPYVEINMHPENPLEKLDAIYFSPHKFLGGPGSSGILIFDSKLYSNTIPDEVGGGTVNWTNPWNEYSYITDIEERENGGTPAFLQTIKVALCTRLKDEMSVSNLMKREKEIRLWMFNELKSIKGLHLLAEHSENRLPIFSFFIDGLHYDLGVKLLNDYFGIQTRGGCDCAGTYGHHLLYIDKETSKKITDRIDTGDLSTKPGWIRLSIHPIMSTSEINYILDSIKALVLNFKIWQKDYVYNVPTNEFRHNTVRNIENNMVEEWFSSLSRPVQTTDFLFENGWGI